jgi:hypothetical protein
MADKPDFSLSDIDGIERSFPTGKPTLICFVKEDCATCNLAVPVLQAYHEAFGGAANVWMIGQEAAGNAVLKSRHELTLPILDDSRLLTSLAWDFESVPALYWIGADGETLTHFEGFVREEWQALDQSIS